MTKPINRIASWLEDFICSEKSHCSNRIGELFRLANLRGRSGFEKWLQFELWLFFWHLDRRQVLEVRIEERIETDARKEKERSTFQTDIVVYLQNKITFGIELKVRRNQTDALKVLHADIAKLGRSLHGQRATENFAIVLCGTAFTNETLKHIEILSENFVCLNDEQDRFSFLIAQA